MDQIESLDICLDCSDRKSYYDVLHSAVVNSPNDAINKEPEGKGVMVGKIFKNDAYKMRLHHFGAVLCDKPEYFTKKYVPRTESVSPLDSSMLAGSQWSEGNAVLLPHHVYPIYQPGETIKGTVVINLKGQLQADTMILNVLGQSIVKYTIQNDKGKHVQTERETYLDGYLTLWRKPETDMNAGGVEKDLYEGTHRFPFLCLIPDSVNSSVSPLVGRIEDFSQVFYRIQVTVARKKFLSTKKREAHRGIWVERKINAANMREQHSPVFLEKSMKTGFISSGSIKCRVKMIRTAFARHESVPVSVEIENKSGGDIDEVIGKITIQGRGRTGTSKISLGHDFNHSTVPTVDGPVRPGQSMSYEWKLPFDFSQSFLDSCVIPASESSSRSQIINFRYEVHVTIRRKGPRSNMEFAIPIEVCTENEDKTGLMETK